MAALKHRFSDDLMAYVSFGQGYKSGGFNGEVANNVTHYQDEGLFRAETVDAWEAGVKGALGDTFTFEAAAFWQDYEAPQARIFVAFPLPGGGAITSNSLSNLDAATVTGAEASALWRPMTASRSARASSPSTPKSTRQPIPRRNQCRHVRWQPAALRIRFFCHLASPP